jgi:hypothetical protein
MRFGVAAILGRVLSLALSGLCLSALPVNACIDEGYADRILFEEQDVKAGLDGPFIARVTPVGGVRNGTGLWVIRARVDEVIKGSFDGDEINIAIPAVTSCGLVGVEAGVSGIVIGRLERDWAGMLEVWPRHLTSYQLKGLRRNGVR